MARLRDVVFDCSHPASLARFWAAALDGYGVAPYDEAELDRLRAAGIDDPEDDPTVLVEAPGVTPRLWFQRAMSSFQGIGGSAHSFSASQRGIGWLSEVFRILSFHRSKC